MERIRSTAGTRRWQRGWVRTTLAALVALLGLACLGWVAGSRNDRTGPPAPSESPRPYLASADAPFLEPVAQPRTRRLSGSSGGRAIPVAISRQAARHAVQTGKMPVRLPDGLAFDVRFERQETSPAGNWTFVGRVATRLGDLAAVITFGRDGAFGVLPTPDGRMLKLKTVRGQAYLEEAGGVLPPGVAPGRDAVRPPSIRPGPSSAAVSVRAAARLAASAGSAVAARTEPASATGTAQAAAPVTIRVLGVVTDNLVDLRGSAAAAETEFTNLLAIATQAHVDSGSVARFELAGIRQADFPAGATNHEALFAMADNALPDGTDIWQARDDLEADLVAMLRPYAEGDTSCGVGFLSGADRNGPSLQTSYYEHAPYGYSVSDVDPCGPLVLAHELGHNLGSAHDRHTETGADGMLSFGAYAYSFGYLRYSPPFATVMAYTDGQPWVGYFSNPDSLACGAPCGTAGIADNVRSLNHLARAVSNFRMPPDTLDVIGGHGIEPASGSASMEVVVRLSNPARSPVGFTLRSSGGTATPGLDYVAFSRSATIAAGEQEVRIPLQLLPDFLEEGNETIGLALSGITGASGPAGGEVLLVDDDPRPPLIGSLKFEQGVALPSTPVRLDIRSTGPEGGTELVGLQVGPGQWDFEVPVPAGARVAIDFDPPEPFAPGTLEFDSADSALFADVLVRRAVYVTGRVRWPEGQPAPAAFDLIAWNIHDNGYGYYVPVSPPEFSYRLRVAPGASVRLAAPAPPAPYVPQERLLGPVHGDLVQDIELRTVPSLGIERLEVEEGWFPWQVPFRVVLSAPAPAGGVAFDLATAPDTAIADDFEPADWGRLLIPEGAQSLDLSVEVLGDQRPEKDEAFRIVAGNVTGAWAPADGSIRLLDDDGPIVTSDFDGDNRSDLFWRHGSSGRNTWWPAADARWQPAVDPAPMAWAVVGIGNFDGDHADDLFWRNLVTGANAIWPSGSKLDDRRETSVPSLAWQVVGTGDFDGDGQDDVLWRHASTGANVYWRSGRGATQQPLTRVSNLDWHVVATGDFDGDSRADILWRNLSTGANTVWRHAASNRVLRVVGVANTDWQVVGAGDFDGDGLDDILWRNRRTGANSVWDAASHARRRNLATVGNLAWEVQAIGDYNGDGRSDVFWRNRKTGANVVWQSADSSDVMRPRGVADLLWNVVP